LHATRYQAGTWAPSRRGVIQVAVAAQGVHTRLVVTAMEQARTPVRSRHLSWARGHLENESTDHQLSRQSERPSWHRVEANHVRLGLHAAADGLLDTRRREVCRTTPWAGATRATRQGRLRKRGARGPECKERLKIAWPASCPVASVLRRCVRW
jgi:Transposase DDE domain group 1